MTSRFVRTLMLRRLTGHNYSHADPQWYWVVLLHVSYFFFKHIFGALMTSCIMTIYGAGKPHFSVITVEESYRWIICIVAVSRLMATLRSKSLDIYNLCVVRLGG